MQTVQRADPKEIAQLMAAKVHAVRLKANGGSVAAQTELARRFARRNKRKEALQWFRAAARSGDPECQMELGIALFWDNPIQREGLIWVKRAAQQGHVGAQYFLGSELATGVNVRRNLREAAQWYRCAAMQNDSEAQYNLALMYWSGEGLRRNANAARMWMARAAKLSDLCALRALAEAYEIGGLGYSKNRTLARFWRRRYDAVNRSAHKGTKKTKDRKRKA